MLDLAAYIGVGLSEIAAMLMVRSVGSIFGSVGSGILFDKFYKISLWMLIIVIISGGLCECNHAHLTRPSLLEYFYSNNCATIDKKATIVWHRYVHSGSLIEQLGYW